MPIHLIRVLRPSMIMRHLITHDCYAGLQDVIQGKEVVAEATGAFCELRGEKLQREAMRDKRKKERSLTKKVKKLVVPLDSV